MKLRLNPRRQRLIKRAGIGMLAVVGITMVFAVIYAHTGPRTDPKALGPGGNILPTPNPITAATTPVAVPSVGAVAENQTDVAVADAHLAVENLLQAIYKDAATRDQLVNIYVAPAARDTLEAIYAQDVSQVASGLNVSVSMLATATDTVNAISYHVTSASPTDVHIEIFIGETLQFPDVYYTTYSVQAVHMVFVDNKWFYGIPDPAPQQPSVAADGTPPTQADYAGFVQGFKEFS